jgi:cytochrome c oxidase assembly factor CtaG
MTTEHLFAVAWDMEPSVIVGCMLLLFFHLMARRFRVDRLTVYFASGVMLLLLTLVGPLDFLGDNYMFSAHMLEHLMLILPVPMLLLLGLPADSMRSLLAVRIVARVERSLSRPALTWLLSVGTMWIWHAPQLYNAALANEGIHAIEHLTMLVTATMFWWLIFSPLPELRMSPVSAGVYIFLSAAAEMLLGVLLTFAPLGYYPAYMRMGTGTGIEAQVFSLIRDTWQITPQFDLQLGGLIMWVLGGLFYFGALMAVTARLFQISEADASA